MVPDPIGFFGMVKELFELRKSHAFKIGLSNAAIVSYLMGMPIRDECRAGQSGLVIDAHGRMLTCPSLLYCGYYAESDFPLFEENFVTVWKTHPLFIFFRKNVWYYIPMNSTQFLYGCVAGLVPPLLWLWFWLKENNLHPEPRSTLAKCFLFGMAGVFVALLLQWLTAPLFAAADNFHRYIVWAAIEEIVKFGVVFFVAFGALRMGKEGAQKNSPNNKSKMDEPIDAMIYMITAALGFAAMENVLFMLGTVSESNLTSVLVVGDMRFIGAILVHVVSSAMVGFMVAASFYCARSLKVIAVVVGLALATALHSAFNLSIISSTSVDTLKVFAWVWGAVVILIIIFEEIKGLEIRHDLLLNKK